MNARSNIGYLMGFIFGFAMCGLMTISRTQAQTFSNIYGFTGQGAGENPKGGLVLLSNQLFGTTYYDGGYSGSGTIFSVNIDGTGYTNIHIFDPNNYNAGQGYTNNQGANPQAQLILSGYVLYGATAYGGTNGNGTLFKLNIDGSGFSNLHTFTATAVPYTSTNSDGANPYGNLLLVGNTLYGTAQYGGDFSGGTIFAINTDGTGFTNLHSFTDDQDGSRPVAGLTLFSNIVYGTTEFGGDFEAGIVFRMNLDGTRFTNLYSFGTNSVYYPIVVNGDGAYPWSRLVLSGNTFFGTTLGGGSAGNGTIFALTMDGNNFTNVHTFAAYHTNSIGGDTNIDGLGAYGDLILSGNTLYGTAAFGGAVGYGTLYSINTDGTGFTNLHSLSGATKDAATVYAGLILANKTLYGVGQYGGTVNDGAIFSLTIETPQIIPPQLTIIPDLPNVILTWPANTNGFFLQSTTNLLLQNWTKVSASIIEIGGQDVLIDPISGTQQFYRLSLE